MPSILNLRKVGSIDFVEGARKRLELPSEGIIKRLHLRIAGTLTTDSSAPVTPKAGDYLRLFKEVEIKLNGSINIVDCSGLDLYMKAYHDFKRNPDGYATLPTNTSTANTFSVDLPIAFYLTRFKQQEDAGIDLRAGSPINRCDIEVTWGQETDLYTTVNAAALSSVTCEVFVEYYADNTRPVTGGSAPVLKEIKSLVQNVAASSSSLVYDIDNRTGGVLSSVIVGTTDADVLEGDILNNLIMKSGRTKFVDVDDTHLLARSEYQGNYDAKTGVHFISMWREGRIGECLDLSSANLPEDLKLDVNVTKGTGTTELVTVVEKIIQNPFNLAS